MASHIIVKGHPIEITEPDTLDTLTDLGDSAVQTIGTGLVTVGAIAAVGTIATMAATVRDEHDTLNRASDILHGNVTEVQHPMDTRKRIRDHWDPRSPNQQYNSATLTPGAPSKSERRKRPRIRGPKQLTYDGVNAPSTYNYTKKSRRTRLFLKRKRYYRSL